MELVGKGKDDLFNEPPNQQICENENHVAAPLWLLRVDLFKSN